MENLKYRLPIQLIEQLEKLLVSDRDLINIIPLGDNAVKFEFKKNKNFFYWVHPKGNDKYEVQWAPHNPDFLGTARYSDYKSSSVVSTLEKWIGIIKAYDKKSALFDDPIIEGFYDEFRPLFSVEDSTETLTFKEEEKVLQMLDYISEVIVDEPDTHIDIIKIREILADVNQNISRYTKKENGDRISKMMAYMRRRSRAVFKKILEEGGNKIIGFGIDKAGEGIVTYGPKLLDFLTN